MRPTLVRSIMTDQAIVTAQVGDTPAQVRRLLLDNPIHHVPVLDGRLLVGVLNARDVLGAEAPEKGTARELLCTRLVTVGQDETVRRAAELMTEHDVQFLPVMEGDVAVGLVTATDILRFLLDNADSSFAS